jgi:hypothetical protein
MTNLTHIDELIDQTIQDNHDKLQREVIEKINPELHTYRNSINILVGRQGLGKSFSAFREIIKISHVDPTSHLLIVINKEGKSNDATYTTLKKLFKIPVVFLSYENAEKTVRVILSYKKLYNTIKQKHLETMIEDEQVDEIFSALVVKNFDLQFLHTLIYFEDCANNPLFKKSHLYFPQLIATCRHNGITFFFSTQFWKSIPTELKSNATTIYIFRDFSSEQLYYILRQTPLKHSRKRIYELYQKLTAHEKLVVDTIRGTLTVDKS